MAKIGHKRPVFRPITHILMGTCSPKKGYIGAILGLKGPKKAQKGLFPLLSLELIPLLKPELIGVFS